MSSFAVGVSGNPYARRVADADAVVADGPHIESAQREDEEHLGGPRADALDLHELCRRPPRRTGDRCDRAALGRTPPSRRGRASTPPSNPTNQRLVARRSRRLEHGLGRERSVDDGACAAPDRLRRLARELLVADGLGQLLEPRVAGTAAAELRQTVLGRQLRHHRIDGRHGVDRFPQRAPSGRHRATVRRWPNLLRCRSISTPSTRSSSRPTRVHHDGARSRSSHRTRSTTSSRSPATATTTVSRSIASCPSSSSRAATPRAPVAAVPATSSTTSP